MNDDQLTLILEKVCAYRPQSFVCYDFRVENHVAEVVYESVYAPATVQNWFGKFGGVSNRAGAICHDGRWRDVIWFRLEAE